MREDRPIVTAFAAIYGLHVARFADPVTRWLYFSGGLLLAAVVASGLHLWVRRQRAGRARAVVARINLGMIVGLPIACAGYLLVNRCLPAHLSPRVVDAIAGRARIEVDCMFLFWAACGVIAAVLPYRIALRVLAWIGAVVMLAVASCDAPWSGIVARGVGGVCVLAAAGFIWVARNAGRTELAERGRDRVAERARDRIA